MIIKSIFKIHFLFYVVSFICIITGLFKPFLIITILIVIHELGHLLMALYYGWKIDKIIIFPFGGVTKFNEKINKPIREEFLILIMGPIIQIIFYFLCDYFFGYNAMLEKYHYTLLIFNLLPIFPLDGSKLVHLFLEKFFSFKQSHLINLLISFIVLIICLIMIINKFNLFFLFLFLLLLIKVFNEYNNHDELFNKFLIERYLYSFNFKKKCFIKSLNVNKMRRDYRHLFLDKNKYITEQSVLCKRFDFKSKT